MTASATTLAAPGAFRDLSAPSQIPRARPVVADREFEELRRDAPDLGVNGVHSGAVKAVLGVYALLLLAFWVFFGGPQTALALGVITVLGAMYFGLLGGGVLVADSSPRRALGRDFGAFLDGKVSIATGWILGREAFAQIILLPVALLAGAIVFGSIWRLTAG